MSKLTESLIKITELQKEIDNLRAEISDEFDDCMYWEVGKTFNECTEKDDYLIDNNEDILCSGGLVDDKYYCSQSVGYCEDGYRGTMFYKTDHPGVFVSVHYEC